MLQCRLAAGQVYRHGYFVWRGASRGPRAEATTMGDGARLFVHAALKGGRGSMARLYIDGSEQGRRHYLQMGVLLG